MGGLGASEDMWVGWEPRGYVGGLGASEMCGVGGEPQKLWRFW